jgi:hypothetical protein
MNVREEMIFESLSTNSNSHVSPHPQKDPINREMHRAEAGEGPLIPFIFC